MSNNFRLTSGGQINRTERISFKFNGKTFFGFKGDTLASALLANGIHLVGRSFKYHRPRGIFSSGAEETNALVQVINDKGKTDPNLRATQIEIFEGFNAESQNCWPTVNFDVGAINNLFSPIIPAGFYYKTFMWPANLWEKYEHFIRRAAGLGKSPTENDPDIYDHKYYHCDVLIVGSGPAGLSAANVAIKTGKKVLLVDERPHFGGNLSFAEEELTKINDLKPLAWIKKTCSELQNNKNIKILNRTSVAAYHNYNYLIMMQNLSDHLSEKEKKGKIRQRLWKVRAKKVILATGSIERPMVFDCNDRPGIMLSSAVRKYINYYGVKCGNNVVIFTNNDDAYETAISLHNRGVKIQAIVDIREQSNGTLPKKCNELGIKILWKNTIVYTEGYKKINKVHVMKLSNNNSSVIGNKLKINCDLLCVSGGYTPAVHLFTQSGGKLIYNEEKYYFQPKSTSLNQISVGSCNGVFNLKKIIEETKTVPESIGKFLNEFKFRQAIKSLMNLARSGNKYLAESEPWKLQKSNPEKVKEILYVGYIIICYITILSEPFLPFTAKKLKSQLNLEAIKDWNDLDNLNSKIDFSFQIQSEEVLFRKIEDDEIKRQIEKLNKMSSQ